MKDKVFIGIQDGSKDGWGEAGFLFLELTQQTLFESPGYKPYWIAEVSKDIWDNWTAFYGAPTVNYTGLNHSAWEKFWDTFTIGHKVMKVPDWSAWKKEHFPGLFNAMGKEKSEKEDA